jgi:hypothetical protein
MLYRPHLVGERKKNENVSMFLQIKVLKYLYIRCLLPTVQALFSLALGGAVYYIRVYHYYCVFLFIFFLLFVNFCNFFRSLINIS